MSTAFTEAAKALKDNPELSNRVMAATTPAERAEILKAAGVTPPTHADISAAHQELSDVSGAGNTTLNGTAIMTAQVTAVAASTT